MHYFLLFFCSLSLSLFSSEAARLAADHVDVIDGSYHCKSVDFTLVGVKPLYFQRTYSSSEKAGLWGIGWSHSYSDGEVVDENRNRYCSHNHMRNDLLFAHDNQKSYIESPDGSKATYLFRSGFTKWGASRYLVQAELPHAPTEQYNYTSVRGTRFNLLSRRTLPEGRVQEIEYYTNYRDKKTLGKVRALKSPAGLQDQLITTHSFIYYPERTEVYDALGRKTLYHFSKDHLLSIDRQRGREDSSYQSYAISRFFWKNGSLRSFAKMDGDKNILVCRSYKYDTLGNVVEETLLGPLSGTNDNLPMEKDGSLLSNGCESYTIKTSYDGYVKTSEEHANGQKILYQYNDQALLQAKFVIFQETILQRQFYQYDQFGNQVVQISDHGTSFDPEEIGPERKITRITPTADYPYGLERSIQECYWDGATERPLRTIVKSYSPEGWLTTQTVLDAEQNLSYVLSWRYNRFGQVVWEKDPLGEITEREYDDNKNLTLERKGQVSTEYFYNRMNYLTLERRYSDGRIFEKCYQYDEVGNMISYRDQFGNVTQYQYDDLNRLICTTFPSGEKETTEYDVLNNAIKTTDRSGSTLYRCYNVRGQVTKIQSEEQTRTFIYNLDGTLKREESSDGTSTQFSYDGYGNRVSEEIFSSSGTSLAKTSALYRAHLLLSETDAKGETTTYSYDGAGRLSRVVKPHTWTEFSYDSLGRNSKVVRWIGPEDQTQTTYYEYDLLDRMIEERVEDQQTTYSYDAAGNRIALTLFHESGPATLFTFYNSFGQPTKIIDALNQETLFDYDYNHVNEQGQKVLCVTKTDANGCKSVSIYDVEGRLSSTSENRYSYEEGRKKVFSREGKEWHYDSKNRLVACIDQSKTYLYSYNSCGQRELKISPDGTILRYSYDSLGRLISLKASDQSIHYTLSYDLNGNLLSAVDEITTSVTTRLYDSSNRLVQETLANGLTIYFTYDGIDRLTCAKLPDDSTISYKYSANYLTEVLRANSSGSYSHHYIARTPSGLVKQEKMIKKTGTMRSKWDPLNRLVYQKSPYHEEIIERYDSCGNVAEFSYKDHIGKVNYRYTYDRYGRVESEEGAGNNSYSWNRGNSLQNSTYTYDSMGYPISNGEIEFTYDAMGRMTKAVGKDSYASYTYDFFNRRVAKISSIKNQKYLYVKEEEVGAVDDEGAIYQLKILGESNATVAIELDGNAFATVVDQNSSVTSLISSTDKRVCELYRYTALGLGSCYRPTIYWKMLYPSETYAVNPWLYKGYRYEPETALLYSKKGYYDPKTAKWISPQSWRD